MRFDRGAGHIDVEIDPNNGWVMTITNERIEDEAEPEGFEIPEELRTMFPHMKVPTRPRSQTVQVTHDQLLMTLGVEEAHQLLGYCSHVCEQAREHCSYLVTGMQEALDAKRLGAVHELNHELHRTIMVSEEAAALAEYVLQAEEAHMDH